MSSNVKEITGYDYSNFMNNRDFWFDQVHPDDIEMVSSSFKWLKEKFYSEITYRWRCSDGLYHWFHDRADLVINKDSGKHELVGSWIDITDRKIFENSIYSLVKKTVANTGIDFFQNLVRNLAQSLTVKYAFISQCVNSENTRVRTLAFWEEKIQGDNFEYDLKGTPCENVIAGKACLYTENIQNLFPDDEDLKKYNAQSYLGIPIHDSKNNIVGHLAVFNDKYLEDVTNYLNVLELFALRAGSEIERIKYSEQLENALDEINKLKNLLETENVYLKEELNYEKNYGEIIGKSASFKKVIDDVNKVADTDATVLLVGETGTGKELLANMIHELSDRKDNSLVKVNCPAIPAGLIESELFGHEKGSFTGALTKKIGKFELADKGTIFLDELADLPLDAQAKLLRVIQEKEFERVGSTKVMRTDSRIIAATNLNLEQLVKEGKFRRDLYYRMNVFPLTVPPLRSRKEDIKELCLYFMDKYSNKFKKKITSISEKSLSKLINYRFPGNIRELENIIERACILSQDEILEISDMFLSDDGQLDTWHDNQTSTLEDMERKYILNILNRTEWKIYGDDGAAILLGMNPNTLRAKMKKLGIKKKIVPKA